MYFQKGLIPKIRLFQNYKKNDLVTSYDLKHFSEPYPENFALKDPDPDETQSRTRVCKYFRTHIYLRSGLDPNS